MAVRSVFAILLAVTWLLPSVVNAEEATAAGEDLFARFIQPLLAKHCLECHGSDDAESGLRLDRADDAYAELDSGAHAIVPGEPNASELLQRVASDDESLRMPPDGDPLSAEEIGLLKRWIGDGAKFEHHWAYRPIVDPPLPDVSNELWIRRSLDRFVLAGLEKRGITPSPEAESAILVKRLYYDLIGLPPTPDEVDAFVHSQDPGAYEQLVDELLASPHFGERWGRHWLDKARYADSDGYEKDNARPNAWRYRDWVIEAINRDMPFDQFTIEQLAGDLLPDASARQKLATAFHRQTLTNTEGGTDQEEFRVAATFDRTETTASVWMALTMTCARCHSHKYDRISQREYYELFAFFNNADEAAQDVPRNEEALAQYEEAKRAHDARIASLTQEYERAKQKLQPQVDRWLSEMTAMLAESEAQAGPVEFSAAEILEAKTAGASKLTRQEDGSLLASGPAEDKDKYTLLLAAPTKALTGFRLEALTHESLGSMGPGRTPHGNFVLSEIRAYISDDQEFKQRERIELVAADADFAQQNFPADGALSAQAQTGWAVAPELGKNHEIKFFTKQPLEVHQGQYIHVVLDQQYGGQHTIGRFRLGTISGFDSLRALPKAVAQAVRTPSDKQTADQRRVVSDYVASLDPTAAALAKKLADLRKKAPQSPMMSVRVMRPAERATRVLHRGDFLQPEEDVTPGALAVLNQVHPLTSRHPDKPADRLDLAQWLVDPNHPLTSRVIVNQVWAHLFGRGIVPTVNDFGVRGELPSHPQMLDWLAWHFARDMRWSRKQLIKTIVMSATYRQSSRHRPELLETDPANRLLARQNRIRVEAELVRDLYLSAGGLLSDKIGGPSVFPPLPPGVAALSYANNFKWKTSEGEDRYRRGMYTFFKRTSPHPTLISFDCPDSNTTRLQRDVSNTPLQALTTLNNDVFAEAAQAFARRVLAEGGESDTERLTYALRLCMAREPVSAEIDQFQGLLCSARDYYQLHPEDAEQLTQRHAAAGVSVSENAAWIATLRMVLNLDEFIVRD